MVEMHHTTQVEQTSSVSCDSQLLFVVIAVRGERTTAMTHKPSSECSMLTGKWWLDTQRESGTEGGCRAS